MVDENYTGPGWIGGGNGATSLSETGEGWFYDLFNWFGALGDVTGSSSSPFNFFTYISSFDNAVGEVSWNYRWLPDSPGGSEPLVVAGVGPRQDGSSMRDALIAACTSRAALSTVRVKSNCKVMRVLPRLELDVISFTPAIAPKALSSGVATVAAMVSGAAPGRLAVTEIVG